MPNGDRPQGDDDPAKPEAGGHVKEEKEEKPKADKQRRGDAMLARGWFAKAIWIRHVTRCWFYAVGHQSGLYGCGRGRSIIVRGGFDRGCATPRRSTSSRRRSTGTRARTACRRTDSALWSTSSY